MTIGYARVSTSVQNLDGQCAVSGKPDAGDSMKSLRETWLGTSTPQGNLLFTIFAGLLQFERDLIRQAHQIRTLYRYYSQNKPPELIGDQTGALREGGKRKEDSRSENPLFSTRTRDRTGMGCPTGV